MNTGFPVDFQIANTRTTNAMNNTVSTRLTGVSTIPGNFSDYSQYLLTSSTISSANDKLVTN